jgi:hypothetical protein
MNEIYLTFAEFDADYVDYICGKPTDLKAPSFLRMYESGPFNTRIAKQMEALGHLALAFTIDAALKI